MACSVTDQGEVKFDVGTPHIQSRLPHSVHKPSPHRNGVNDARPVSCNPSHAPNPDDVNAPGLVSTVAVMAGLRAPTGHSLNAHSRSVRRWRAKATPPTTRWQMNWCWRRREAILDLKEYR